MSAALYSDKIGEVDRQGNQPVQRQISKLLQGGGSRQAANFIFSDFQQSNFPAAEFARLAQLGPVYLAPVSAAGKANVYVDSLLFSDEFVRPGADLELTVRLRNGGSSNATNSQVRLLIGDVQAGAFQVDVPAKGTATVKAKVRISGNGPQQGRIELEDEAVAFDNTYYFTLQPAGRIRVLDIATSLTATQRVYPNEAVFTYSRVSPGAAPGALTDGADLVLLQELPRIGADLRRQLAAFVERGGNLVVVPAAAAVREDYQNLFADLALAAIRFQSMGATKPELRELAFPSAQSPFFRNVFGEQVRQPEMPKAAPLLTWSRSSTDLLRLRDGDAFLSGFRSGAGMVYVFASPFGQGYSTFPDNALFVPVMYRLAMQSYSATQAPAYRLGQPVALRAAAAAGTEPVYKLQADTASWVPAQQRVDGQLLLQLPAGLQQAGFYDLTLSGKRVTTLAFNPAKSESELAYYSAAELRQLTAAYPNVHVYEAGSAQSLAAQLREQNLGTALWRYCLLVALLALLGEVLLLRFGRRNTPALAAA